MIKIKCTNLQESLVQSVLSDVQHLGAVDAAVIIHLLDDQPVGEGRDVQHVQQRGLAGAHLVSRFDQLNVTLWAEQDSGFSSFAVLQHKLEINCVPNNERQQTTQRLHMRLAQITQIINDNVKLKMH